MSNISQTAPPPAHVRSRHPHPWRRRILWVLLLLTCLTAGVSLLTQWGLRLTVNELQRLLPGLAITHVEGTLAGHIAMHDVRYVSAHEELHLDSLSIDADPLCLIRRRICIEDIAIGTLDWHTTVPRPSTGFDFPAVALPAMVLPVNITLSNVRMKEMIIRDKRFRMSILDARLRAHTDRQHVIIQEAATRLQFGSFGIDAELSGDIDLRGDRTVNLSPRVVLDFGGVEDLQIRGNLRGPALTPSLQASTKGLVDASVELQASFLEKGWPVKGRVQDLEPTRLTEDGLTLSDTTADISGHVTRYHLKGTTRVSGIPHVRDVIASIETTGGFNGLEKAIVNARFDDTQKARYEGRFDWYPALAWKGELSIVNLDVGQWIEQLKTRISGSTRTEGRWWIDTPLHLGIEDLNLEGSWQGHAIRAQMDGESTGWDARIDSLAVTIGKNRIDASGTLGEQWDASVQLDLPALDALLPGLQGNILGQVDVKGDRHDPIIHATAESPLLVTGGNQWESVKASVSGTPGNHRVTADASTLGYGLAIMADGRWKDGLWQGRAQRLELTRDKHPLVAPSPVIVNYQLDQQRLEIKDLCLVGEAVRPRERWCGNARMKLSPLSGDVTVRLENADPAWLSPFIASYYKGAPGRWTGQAALALKGGRPVSAEWTASGRQVQLKRVAGKLLRPTLTSDKIASQGKWSKNRLQASVSAGWASDGFLDATVDIPSLAAPSTFTMSAGTRQLPVSWITPWITGIKSKQGEVSGKLVGRVEQGWPRLDGEVMVADTALQLGNDSDNIIDKLGVTLIAANDRVTVEASFIDPQGARWQLTEPVSVRIDPALQRLQWLAGCLGNEAGALCGTGSWDRQTGLIVDATAKGSITPWVAPFLQEGVVLDGPFEGRIALGERHGRLHGNATFHSTVTAERGLEAESRNSRAEITVNAMLENGAVTLESTVSTGAQGELTARAQLGLAPPHSLDGRLDIQGLDLAAFAPLLPDIGTLQGRLDGNMRASGTTSAPGLAGEFTINDGKASSARFPLTLQHFTARAALSDTSAVLTAGFSNGRGTGELRSRADWSSGKLITDTHMTTRQYPLRRGSEIKIRVDSDLTLRSQPGDILLEGLVKIDEGFIRIASLPESATQISSDVVYVDGDDIQDAMSLPNVRANVTLQLNDLLQIDALGAQVRMKGAVGISYAPPLDPEGKGSFNVTEGYYKGYGQKLTIRKGQIIFNGPLDNPMLAIIAVREVDGVEAGLNITGPAQQPETTLFANKGGLSEQDILTYIITGRAPSEGAGDNRAAVNQALLAIGLYGGENVARDLASKVGIEDLEISTSSTQRRPNAEVENSFNVGGYVSPRLFVQYGVGINTPVNTLTLRYRLSRNVFLEALSGAESALDLLYSFEVERTAARE